jgi:hypothetical protein
MAEKVKTNKALSGIKNINFVLDRINMIVSIFNLLPDFPEENQ